MWDTERLEKAKSEGVIDYNAYGMTLRHLSRIICDGIVRRAAVGKNYGTVIIPEGILEFINEIQVFIIKLNTIMPNTTTSMMLIFTWIFRPWRISWTT